MNESEFTEQDFQDLMDIILDCENEITDETNWIHEGTHKACAYDRIIQEIDVIWDNLPVEVQERYRL